ncbi:MAG TPA: hypothetical protein VHO94_04300 [Oscillospiraceae bacterium]|nr:hypothetical protein [Oscillospiraceae bacterium]
MSKWYEKNWVIILFLIFLFPVGLVLMWMHKSWNKVAKIIITVVGGFIYIMACVTAGQGGSPTTQTNASPSSTSVASSSENSSKTATSSEQSNASTSTSTSTSTSSVSSNVSNQASVSSKSSMSNTKSTTSSAVSSSEIGLVNLTTPVGRNETATISIKGAPNTNYSIKVMYSESASTAKGLEDKTSDSSGKVSWSWKIGAKTALGSHEITINGGGKTFDTTFVVTK